MPIARLLGFIEHGERLAHECASAQAELTSDAGMKRFLKDQARQEAMHARVFQGAITWLAPRHVKETPPLPALEEYRALLTDALRRGDWFETLLGEQVILEGLGEAILTRIEEGLAKRRAPFGRLRRMLLHQEEAHHGFGRRVLERAMSQGRVDPCFLRRSGEVYLTLTTTMITTLADLFESIDEDPALWARDVRGFLPAWLTE